MANNEAEITVSLFNQDFNKSMKEMGRETGKLNQEFKLQQEQMKLTATDAEKLAAKVEFLNKKQELAKKKVEETEKQYEAIKAQFGENSQAAQDMARKLNSARIEEQQLANQIQETNDELIEQNNKLKKASEALADVGDKMKDAGETMSTGVTAPIVAIGAGALKVASDFDSAAGQIQAQLGLTAEEAENLRDSAQDIWQKGFGENIGEVTDGLAIVKQNMQELGDVDLSWAAELAFILQKSFGVDISESTRTASVLMKNFGIDASTAFDLITVGFQRGGNFSDELLDTMREYGPQFKAMGYDAEGMTAVLIAGAQKGAFNLDKIGDVAKESFLRIGDGSKASVDALAELGLNTDQVIKDISSGGDAAQNAFIAVSAAIAKVKDPAKQSQLAIALMGSPLEDLGPEFQDFFSTVDTELGDFEGSTKKAGDTLQNTFGMRLSKTFRELQTALQPLGEILLNMAEKVLPKLSGMVEKVANWFSELSPSGKNLVVIIGGILAAIGPFLVILGHIATGVSVVVGWFAPLAAAIAEAGGLIAWLGPVFTALSGPIGWIIAAVVGLIAVFVALWKNNEDFRNKVIEIWESIKTGFQIALEFIWNIIQTVMTNVMSFVGDILGKLKAFWDENGQGIMTIVKTVFGGIWEYIKMVFGIIQGIFQVVWPIIVGIVKLAWANIKVVFSTALDIILGAIQFFTKLFTGDWKGAFNTVKETAEKIMNNIKKIFKDMDLLQIGKDIINGLIKGLKSMANAVKDAVVGLADKIPDWAKKALGIHSPSRVMMELGEFTGEGLLVGVEKKIADAKKMALELAKAITPTMPGVNGQIATTSGSLDVAFGKGQLEAIQNAFSSSVNRNQPIQGDVYIDSQVAGEILAPLIKEINDFNERRVGGFKG